MSANAPTPINAQRQKELWRRYARDRNQSARAELLALYLPIARRMAGRYAGVAEPYDDLVQVASLGLLNAIDRFDPSRGTPFIGFAKPTIMGELKRHFRDKVWTVRVPRAIHDLMGRVETVSEALASELGRSPSVAEIATELAVDPVEVLEVFEVKQNRRALSLDARSPGEDDDSPPEWLGEVDSGFELIEERLTLGTVLPNLDERERQVLRLRFIDDMPQSKIAAEVGCSQMHVSRLLRRTLDRLRAEAEEVPEAGAERAVA